MQLQSRFACLTYHLIGNGDSQYEVTERQLRDHLAFLTSEGYCIDDFEGLEARLSKRSIPVRYAILTVDDGHESSMRAAEVFCTYGCQATFFLTRNRSLNKPGFLRASQIRELREGGFSIGAHGTTHRKLTFLSQADCEAELHDSKAWLEDVLGESVQHMAAPGGYINRHVLRLAIRCGYTLVGTCKERMNSADSMTLPGTVNRVNVRQRFSIGDLLSIVSGHAGFYAWRQLRAAALMIPKQVFR